MKPVFFLLVALAVISTACGALQPGAVDLPIPSRWSLVSMGKTGSENLVQEGSMVTLEINEEGRLGGSAGCNSYGAQYQLDGKNLTVREVVSTLMACADDLVMQQESQYLSALQGATRFELSSDSLTIFYNKGESQLNFVKQ